MITEKNTAQTLSCVYRMGGGMDGKVLEISVEQISDTEAEFSFSKSEFSDAEPVKYSYKIDLDPLRRIKQLYEMYGVEDWGILPNSDFIALDAPTISIKFCIGENCINLDSTKQLPENGQQLFREVRRILGEYEKKQRYYF